MAILLSYERWSSKFSIGTRKSVWYCVARVQDGSAKTTLYFHHLKKKKKNLKLSPPKHFINLIYHRKAYTGSRRAMLNLTVLKLFCFSLLLATLLKMQLSWGVWPDLQGKLFSSCLFLLFLNGKKKKKTHNARFLYLLLQHKSK